MFTLAFFLIFSSSYALYNCSKRALHVNPSFNTWVVKRVKKTQFTSIIVLGVSYMNLQVLYGFGKGFFVFMSILILVNCMLIALTPLGIMKTKTLAFLFMLFLGIEYLIPFINAS
ncbi:MAG: hypothetical protein HRT69_14395 [Flavobacteriaceae bacterium]|nr:hypothetical protein [Flavobacteriaceae bacterium]